MKIWEKIYLVVIALFLLVLNVCNILVFQSSYQKSVDSVKQGAESSWKHMAYSMTEDLSEMEGNEAAEWRLFQSYVSNYSTDGSAFELWRGRELRERSELGSQVTYSASEGEIRSEFMTEEERNEIFGTDAPIGQVTIWEREGEKYTCSAGELSGTGFWLVIYENVTEGLRVWEGQIVVFLWMEMAASVCMALLLYFVMKKFLQPLSGLSEMTADIAAGNYNGRIEVKGHDELSSLARDINHMAGQVQESMEQKEAEVERKEDFIQALSHELRTPLTSVRGYAELIRNTAVSPDKQMDYLDYIVRESGRVVDIAETLRQVLLWQEDFEVEEISLREMKEWLTDMVDRQFPGQNICFTCQAEDGTVMGNRTLVEVFFLNLVRNSCHACRDGGNISVVLNGGGAVISDTGIGMGKECVKHIYEPFYREDKSRSRKLGGSGLGMYLCRKIADWHDWTIKIDSEKGVGTRIEIIFYNSFTG